MRRAAVGTPFTRALALIGVLLSLGVAFPVVAILAYVGRRHWLEGRARKPYVAWFVAAYWAGVLLMALPLWAALGLFGVDAFKALEPRERVAGATGLLLTGFLVGTAACVWLPASEVVPPRPDPANLRPKRRTLPGKGRPRTLPDREGASIAGSTPGSPTMDEARPDPTLHDERDDE